VSSVVVTTTFATGHHGFVAVVGESNYQPELRALGSRLGPDGVFTARLVPEPQNSHDINAVSVCVDENGAGLGYLGRAVAKVYNRS
jgi:hypothetical protein